MLHRLEESVAAPALRAVVQLQRDVLAMACDTAYPVQSSEAGIRAAVDGHFTGTAAEWVWKRMWDKGRPANGPSELQARVNAAAAKVRAQGPGVAQAVLDAFDHDITFDQNTGSAVFRFGFAALPDPVREAVTKLGEHFYTLLGNGYPAEVHGQAGTLDLQGFKAAFWQANPTLSVCPCCDRSRPDVIGGADASDADHFFPKSRYPFLSVHPRNLVPTCTECNQRAKRALDPITSGAAQPMLGVFHPYVDPPATHALQVRVGRRGAARGHTLRLLDGGASTDRVKTLSRVWKLEERWTERMRDVAGTVYDFVRQLAMMNPVRIERAAFEKALSRLRDDRVSRYGRAPNYILEAAYLTYALADRGEMDALYRYYEDALDPSRQVM